MTRKKSQEGNHSEDPSKKEAWGRGRRGEGRGALREGVKRPRRRLRPQQRKEWKPGEEGRR